MPRGRGRFRDALRQIIDPPATVAREDAGDEPLGIEAIDLGPWAGIAPLLDAEDGRRALKSMAYLACELAKARPISMLPVHIYESDEDGRSEARDPVSFRLANLLRTRWNPTLKAPSALQWAVLAKDTLGEAYVRVEWGEDGRGREVPVALWPLTGAVQRLWDDERGSIWYLYAGDQFTPQGLLSDREVVQLSSPLTDLPGTRGRSLARAAMAAVNLDIEEYEFYQRLLENGLHVNKWLETDQRLRKPEREEFMASVKETSGIFNAGGLRVFDNGMKLHQSDAKLVDLSYLDEARWVLQTVCRICGVPPNEVYDNSQLTYSGNVEMSAIQFASKTLMPECREIESAFDCVLRSAGLFETHVKLDMNGLLRGQYESRMKGYQIGRFSGFFTANEIREWEELPKLPGGDVPMWPTNQYQMAPDGTLIPPPKADGSEPPGTDGAAGDIPSEPEKALADARVDEEVFHEQMRARIRERFQQTGDTPATRKFAGNVLAPWAHFCARVGIPYDFDSELEELMRP